MSEPRSFLNGRVVLHAGDCRDVLKTLADNSVDSVVTDPPYALVSIGKRFGKDGAAPAKSNGATGVYARASSGFMGCSWDHGAVAFDPNLWAEVLRCMKPGAHGLAMGGTRTFHRLVCAIEDSGAEIRDCLVYAYGSGFPKSLSMSKQLDKMASPLHTSEPVTDAAREWDGWGTALKPAVELICMFRKSLSEANVAANVLRWGTGAINVGASKIPGVRPDHGWAKSGSKASENTSMSGPNYARAPKPDDPLGRWPANLIHDGSDEVLACFPESKSCGFYNNETGRSLSDSDGERGIYGKGLGQSGPVYSGDSGSAARFFASFPQDDAQRIFYTSKAGQDDRLGSSHPTIKPIDLIQYLVRLITPKNGVCLDLFAGTGTTAEAAYREGFRAILIEREAEYIADIERRMSLVMEGPVTRAHAGIKARGRPVDNGPLFGGSDADLLDVKIELAKIAVALDCDIDVRFTKPIDEASE